jgi:hypothetical protein
MTELMCRTRQRNSQMPLVRQQRIRGQYAQFDGVSVSR